MLVNRKTRAYFLCVIAYAIFGFSFLFSKKALVYASPMVFVGIRFVLAFIILNLILLTGKVKISFRNKPVWKLMLLGIIQPCLYFVCETYGIEKTSSAFAGVMLGLLPVGGLLLGSLILKESFTLHRVICVILSVIGVAMTTVGGPVSMSFTGTVLLLCAVTLASFFSIISRSASKQFAAFEKTYVMFMIGSIFFAIAAIIEVKGDFSRIIEPLQNSGFVFSVVYLAAASSVCAFMFINYALQYITVGAQTLISNFCTVVSVIAGIVFMDERFAFWQIAGIVVVILSMLGITAEKKKKVRGSKEKACENLKRESV